VVIASASNTGNRILDNSISSNGLLGIDLGNNGVTTNDPRDPDTDANNPQNFPKLTSATRSADGETLIGELNVKTNRFGKVSFNFITVEDVTAGEAVTATATAFSTKETSEFSAPRTVSSS
jgi:hypothetical protein